MDDGGTAPWKEPVEPSREQRPRAMQGAKAEFTRVSFLLVKEQSSPRETLGCFELGLTEAPRAFAVLMGQALGALGDAVNDHVSRISTIC